MKRSTIHLFAVVTVAVSLLNIGHAQDKQTPEIVRAPLPAAPDNTVSLPPLADPATPDQIREYLRLSGDMDSFRAKWIAAVDKNRSIGAPYWPEAFWTDLKAEMQKTDLMPMYITLFQHEISRELMQRVLDAYKRFGADHFTESLECIELGGAELSMKADADKLTLAKTLEITKNVYAIYKPEIEAARMRYMAAQSTIPPTVQPVEPPATQPTQQPALASPASTPTEPPSPNPNTSGTHQGGVTGPKIFYQPEPQFSEIARQQKINGTVTVSIIVDAQGNPQNAHVVHSIADTVDSKHRDAALTLDQAAIDTVRKYKFTPAMLDGRPVAVYLNVAVNFQIN
jgi:protein TonB